MTDTATRPRGGRLAGLLGLTTLGDEAFTVGLPVALLSIGVGASAPALVHGALYLSLVLAGLLVGGIVDGHETYGVVRRALWGSAAVVVVGGLVMSFVGYPLAVSVVIALCLGVPGAAVAAAVDAGAGRTDPSRVTRLYGAIESVRTGATIVGPLLGGVLAAAGVRAVLGMYAVLFTVGSVLARGHLPPEDRPSVPRRRALAEGMTGAMAEYRSNPALLRGVAFSSSLNIGLATIVPLSLSRLKLDYALSGPAIGLCLAVVGAVSVVAAQAAGRIGGSALAVPAVVTSLLASLVGFATGPVLLTLPLAAASAAAIFFNVRWRAFRQRVTPAWRLGSVSSWSRSIAYSWIAGVSFVGAWVVATGVAPQQVQVGAGVASVLAVLACITWSRAASRG